MLTNVFGDISNSAQIKGAQYDFCLKPLEIIMIIIIIINYHAKYFKLTL